MSALFFLLFFPPVILLIFFFSLTDLVSKIGSGLLFRSLSRVMNGLGIDGPIENCWTCTLLYFSLWFFFSLFVFLLLFFISRAKFCFFSSLVNHCWSICLLLTFQNGFWASVGWCVLLFLPCVVLAMVLASLYRKTDPYPGSIVER